MKQTDCQKVEKKSKLFFGHFWGENFQIFEEKKNFLDSILTSFREIEAFGIFYAFEYNCLRVESVTSLLMTSFFVMTSS